MANIFNDPNFQSSKIYLQDSVTGKLTQIKGIGPGIMFTSMDGEDEVMPSYATKSISWSAPVEANTKAMELLFGKKVWVSGENCAF